MKFLAPRVYTWLLAALVPIFAIYPALMYAIEERAYDAAVFHIYRGVIFSAARADGSFYPRWVQAINGGLGGPLFEFYSPLAYFLMDTLNWVGIPHPLAWRVLTAIFLLAASLGMFGLGLVLFKRADTALLAATIFVYNPYLLRDLFERGTPQGFVLALLPLMIWLLHRVAENFSALRLSLAALYFAAMILLHNATTMLLMPVVLIFVVFKIAEGRSRPLLAEKVGRKRPATRMILSFIAGLALAAFYLIPYLAEIQYVQFDNLYRAEYALPANNPLRLSDILSVPRMMDVGLGNNAFGEGGELLNVLVLLLAIPVGLQFYQEKNWAELFLVIGNLLLVIGALALQSDSATWVWKTFPALNAFQFRWRLLAPLAFVSAIIVGYFFSTAGFLASLEMTNRVAISLLITFYVLLSLPLPYPDLLFRYNQFAPQPTVADVQAFMLDSNVPGLTAYNELLPRWRQSSITNYTVGQLANLPNVARIVSESHRNGFLKMQIETPREFAAEINVLYFPGWVATMDGDTATISPSPREGLITREVPAGLHTVELRYVGTNVQRVGEWISIATLITLILFVALSEARDRVARNAIKRDAKRSVASLPQNDTSKYFSSRWWIPVTIILLAAVKAFWVDPHTTLFRVTSTCDAVQDAVTQTNIIFDNHIRMCGYILSRQEFQANDQLLITIYWQTESTQNATAFSFVHLLGEKFNPETGNPLWGQQDKQAPGEHLLTTWVAGKIYRDVYEFRIAPNAPRGAYQLEIGWQDEDGKRLAPRIITPAQNLSISNLNSLLISGIIVR